MECEKCGLGKTAQFNCITGQGPVPCKIMLVGEAPPYRKERDKPFAGEAGKVLDDILNELGVTRDEVYVTSIVKCRPPENRKPRRSEIAACKQWLREEVKLVNPQFVLLLGGSAAQYIYENKVRVMEVRGKFHHMKRTYMVTISPGAVLKDETKRPLLFNDVRRFIELARGSVIESTPLKVTIVRDLDQFSDLYQKILSSEIVSLDIETTTLSPWAGYVVTVGFGLDDGQYIVPLQHREGPWYDNFEAQKSVMQLLAPILKIKSVVCHNGKFDTLWLKVRFGVDIPVSHDTMMLSHVLDENHPHGLKYLAEVCFGADNYDLTVEQKTGGAPLDVIAKYNALDVHYTRELYKLYRKELSKDPKLKKFYELVVMPAVNAFREIEFNGVYIDVSRLNETRLHLQAQLAKLQAELNEYKPGVNWNSTQQLAEFLFNDLGLSPLDRTPKGAFSTAETVLKRLDHPAVKTIMAYRESSKHLGTFIRSWTEKHIDSRLHPSFKLHGTVTGRLSCEEPNLQQVPRDPKIRSLVTAPTGYTFIEADFSQVELRIAAMLSDDPVMKELFLTGEDIHLKTARAVSHQDISKLSDFEKKEWRKKAKAINFGFLYGMGAKKFQEYARDKYEVNFSIEESAQIRERFFKTYPGLQPWYKKQERQARMNGWVQSPSGRVRHLPTINSDDEYEQSQAVRQAINSPVQGFASDLTIMSVLDIMERLPDVRIVGTVHDSILMEVPDDRVASVLPSLQAIMENPPRLKELGVQLTVPIKVEIKTGHWGS